MACPLAPDIVKRLTGPPGTAEQRHMKASTRVGTVALVVRFDNEAPALIETISDDHEIAVFESAMQSGESDPLAVLHETRARQSKEDEEFGNYVEDLLSQPFVRPEIQEHGLQWLKSKIRIEQFQRCERDAAVVIAGYALKIFQEDPGRTDFFLAGPQAKVRVRIFTLGRVLETEPGGTSEAA